MVCRESHLYPSPSAACDDAVGTDGDPATFRTLVVSNSLKGFFMLDLC